tara:strand:- start:720 stop:1481 length:762 start_codon:yes stop_codon:yes gene_type:complete
MSLALYPALKIGDTERKLRESISRITTGLNILGGSGGAFAQGIGIKAEADSNHQVASTSKVAQDFLLTAEAALVELAALATRLRELGIADTSSTNSASDTAALNASAVAVSDSIDDIVSSLQFNNINVLDTSAVTKTTPKDVDGNLTTIKTTEGIAATNITDATNSNTTADTALASITTSMGHVSGHLTSLQAYGDVSSSISAIEMQSAARLMDTNFAMETAKLLKNSLISSYAHNMVSEANDIERKKLILLA